MTLKILFVILLLFLACKGNEAQKIPPKAVKGVLDLRSVETFRETSLRAWDFEKDGTINLDGEWEFYWNEFLEPRLNTSANLQVIPEGLSLDTEGTRRPNSRNIDNAKPRNPDYIAVPGNWNSFEANGKQVNSIGYATYRLRILLPKLNTSLAFKILNASTAYTMYVNGEKFASNGSVGKDKETSIPQSLSVISSIHNSKEELEILLHVSNFHYSKGGLWLPIKIGNEKAVREIRDKNLFLDIFLSGSILIMGLYHLVIYIQRKQDKSPLLFGIYCFIIVVRLLSTGEKYLTVIFPEIPFQLLIKIEYISFYLAVPIFSHFLYTIFPREVKEKILKFIWAIGILFAISVIVTSTEIFTRTVNAYQILTLFSLLYFLFIIGLAIFRKREGSKTIFVGCLIIIIGVVNDILYNRNILSTGNIFPQCLLGFTFFQSIMLSMRFSRSFSQAEKLSNELEQKSSRLEETSLELSALTQNLEIKIQERTQDLEETKKEIEDINTFSHLVNSLSDLNSIFTEISKYFYHKFGITGTWLFLPDEKREYLYAYKAYSYHKLSADKYNYLMNKKIPMKENKGGMIYKTFQRKKPFYLSKIPKFEFEIDKEFGETLSLHSFLLVPLIRKEESVGIFSFSNMHEEMKLSKSDIHKISNLCSGIAGAIDTNHLLQQVEKAKTQADAARIEAEIERGISVIAKMEVEKAKQETEELNKLVKSLNEDMDIKVIMKKVHEYIKNNYNINYYGLAAVDKDKEKLTAIDTEMPEFVALEDRIRVNQISTKIKDTLGAHAIAFKSKTPFYFPRIRKSGITLEELFTQETLKFKSLLIIPLILQNEPIGFLDLYNVGKMELSKEDITKLSILGEQLAGIIHGSNLLKQVQEEKEKSEKAKQEIETLNEFTKLINSTSDISLIFKEIYSYLNRAFGFTNLWVLLVNKNSKELYSDVNTTIYNKEDSLDSDFFNNFHVKLDEKLGTLYQTYTTAVPFYIADVSDGDIKTKTLINGFNGKTYSSSKTDFKIIVKGKLKSLLQIPLILQDEVIGIVCLSIFNKLLELSQYEIEKLVRFSNQIAGVIHNAQLLKQTEEAKGLANIEIEKAIVAQLETEKAKDQIEFLNEFSKVINSYNNLEIIFSHAVQELCEKLDADLFILQLLDKAKNELFTRCISGNLTEAIFKKHSNLRLSLTKHLGAVSFTYSNKKTTYLQNLKKIPKDKWTDVDIMYQSDFRFNSAFQIPLLVQDEVIGILHINKVGGMRKLTKDEIRFSESLCEQLALAVNNSYLYEEAERAKKDAETQKQEVEKLNEFAKRINENFNLDEVLNLIGSYIAENFNIGHYLLWRMDRDKSSLYPYKGTFSENISETDIKKFYKLRIPVVDGKGLHATVCRSQRHFFVHGMKRRKSDSEAENEINELLGFESLLIVPLIIQNEIIGTMDFSHYSKKLSLTKDDIRRISIFCEQIAGVIHGASLLEVVERERQKSEKLLLNILPKDVASELKEKGFAEPVLFENVSVMFTDFKGFTTIAETLSPQELIKDLDACFVQFDKISERFNLEKLKTIGDSYMCAGGIPKRNTTHAIDCCLAALEIQTFMNLMKKLKEEKGFPYWELRLGIHTGPLIAGVIGERKFAYDVWGDTVNTASRMESSGTPGKINISYSTYEIVKDYFECEYRGEVSAKNKGVVKMYYLERIKPEFSKDEMGLMPNGRFWEMYG